MPIRLTCSCGQCQSVASAMAGQTIVCVGCGKTRSVPPREILVRLKAEARAALADEPSASPSSRVGVALLATLCLVLLVGISGWLLWSLGKEPEQTKQLAQANDPNPDQLRLREAPPDEHNRVEPPKTEPALVQALPRPKETPATPIPVIEPPPTPLSPTKPPPVRESGDSPTPAPEPVKPGLDLLPVKEKDKPPAVKDPPNVPEPARLVWRLKEGETFYQELIVTQKPNFRVQGLPVTLLLQYRVVSRFTVQKANEDGSLVVQQKVETARLLQADDLTRGAIAEVVARLPGTTFNLHLSPKMEVTQFQGAAAALQPGLIPFGAGQGLQMVSLLDRDGWKELVQATFFQMDQPLQGNARWSKALTHQWGSLGSWAGQVQYVYLGQQGPTHKIAYGLQLAYKAPAAGAAIGGMAVKGANFQAPDAGGLLLFDAVRGKVVAAEERFRVKGVLNTSLLGQNTAIEIDEDQHFLIRIHEKMVP